MVGPTWTSLIWTFVSPCNVSGKPDSGASTRTTVIVKQRSDIVEVNEKQIVASFRLALKQGAVRPVSLLHCECIDLQAACRYQVS